ncbi:MAG: MBL fold metallo-hydrolase [Bacteroidia bacterium]
MRVHQLTFNPFAENTYLLEKDSQVIVIDPGMYTPEENVQFKKYIDGQNLEVVHLLLTHAHLDHVFGVKWVNECYELTPRLHKEDDFIYENAQATANQYGLFMEALPQAEYDLHEGDTFDFHGSDLQIIHTPGHSPGSLCFISHEDKFVIGGDVLFQGSIGRTDLPGGNYQTLIDAIKTKLMPLSDDYRVYSGHGPMTTIGQERISNPFLQD